MKQRGKVELINKFKNMRQVRLYLVVHDGSQAHYAHMYIISLVGTGLLMHPVPQSGAYSAEG